MRCLCFSMFSLLMNTRCILAWDDTQTVWKCCPLFALTDVTTCKIKITTNPSLEYAQSTTPTLNSKKRSNQTINEPVQQPRKQNRFSHPKNESTTAASKQCNYVHCSFLWILSLPPFWLIYLSCFPSQVYIYIYMYVYFKQAYIHTRMNVCAFINSYIHAFNHPSIQTDIHKYTYTHTHTHANI